MSDEGQAVNQGTGANPPPSNGQAASVSQAIQGGTPPVAKPAEEANKGWYSDIADADLRGWVEVKNFKDRDAALKGYRELEKFSGKDPNRLVELPKDWDNPDETAALYNKLGRPETAEGYEFPKDSDAEFKKLVSEAMHKNGVTKAAAKGLIDAVTAYAQGQQTKQTENNRLQQEQEIEEVKQEWGLAHKSNLKRVDTAANVLGISPEEFKAIAGTIGVKKTLNMFNNIYAKMGEPELVGSVESKFFSPEGAREKQNALLKDEKFMKSWTDATDPGHSDAVKKFNTLTSMITKNQG